MLNTWNNTGDFYIRVRGRNGSFSLDAPYRVQILLFPGGCDGLEPNLDASTLGASGPDYETLILTDFGRLSGDTALLQTRLAELATAVTGTVVDVGADARVASLNADADTYYDCPYAKNLVASDIRRIVAEYKALNADLKYVVIVGGDNVIPFFRHPDAAMLGPESDYVPPVLGPTASQASLRLNYVLSQDAYGAPFDLSLNSRKLPIPQLAVGRLVETPLEIMAVIDAYLELLDTTGGVIFPETFAVTGYDFLADVAQEIAFEFSDPTGLGGAPPPEVHTLIDPSDKSPLDPGAWTADDLGSLLLDPATRHDMGFLAGHFSANAAMAADFETHLLTTDLVASTVDMANAVFFSAGCHSGYNIVNEHDVPGLTWEPDWAQAFAEKGATLIGGTGYQYGDTEFIEYSERLYLEFVRQLRTEPVPGGGPVSIGEALVAAKRKYLRDTPTMRGIHEKAYLEATIFGLPMLSVQLANQIPPAPPNPPLVSLPLSSYAEGEDPGYTLGLAYDDVTVSFALTPITLALKHVDDGSQVVATYYRGRDGVLTNPAEPALPLHVENVTVPAMVLRGVGFRGGSFQDIENILPLTGAPATEIRGVHTPFQSDVFFPIRPWSVNYFGALYSAGGVTHLALTPVQHQSSSLGSQSSTVRRYSDMMFRLFYSNHTAEAPDGTVPAKSDAPTIVRVGAVAGATSIALRAGVVGNPSAGIQEVWATYYIEGSPNPEWKSVDLIHDATDSRLWEGTLPLDGADPGDFRFIVQAVNGVGLISAATNFGEYYSLRGIDPPLDRDPTSMDLILETESWSYGGHAWPSVSEVRCGETLLTGASLEFGLGSVRVQTTVGEHGDAWAEIPLINMPGSYRITASFAGNDECAPASASLPFTITKAATDIYLQPAGAPGGAIAPQVRTSQQARLPPWALLA